ncbi:hypothetical protein F5X99DRAFT_430129 [Biscogniauxia marginata]|nr:hypothetical protein F5X99DRAFT_430129 [Biscogniauxia marginata]
MPEDSLESELQGLSLAQLREVVQQLCTRDPPPGCDNDQKDHGHDKDTKRATLDLIKEVKSRLPEDGEEKEDQEQERPTPTVSPDSTTLVASPSSSTNESTESRSTGGSRSGARRTNNLTPEDVQNLFGMEGLEPIQRCGRCRSWFTESHNSDIACTWHPKRVLFRDADHLAFVPTFASWEHRYVPASFRWACCGDQINFEIEGNGSLVPESLPGQEIYYPKDLSMHLDLYGSAMSTYKISSPTPIPG